MGGDCRKKIIKAKIVEYEDEPCNICLESCLDEVKYGKMYQIQDITVHYFCVLLSTTVVQKGTDDEGLLGFLYEDILKNIRINKKNNCYYCGLKFASVKCNYRNCPIVFHLPCGIRNNCISLFQGSFPTFCENHRIHQKIPIEIYESREELLWPRLILNKINAKNCVVTQGKRKKKSNKSIPVIKFLSLFTCSICMEEVYPFPSTESFWPPCCKKDKWFHRTCISKLALSAGKHFIKCPLCNNQQDFLAALQQFGFYIPDRDASWELENSAFQDLLFRPKTCYIENCICPRGKNYKDKKRWTLIICSTCGSQAAHKSCINWKNGLICNRCIPNTPALQSSSNFMPSTISMVPKTSTTPRLKPVSPRKVPEKTPKPGIPKKINPPFPEAEGSLLRRGRKRYREAENPANIAFIDKLPEDEKLPDCEEILKIKYEPIDDYEDKKITEKEIKNPEDELIFDSKSIKQEKIDSSPEMKKPCFNNLNSWLGIQNENNNIDIKKSVKIRGRKKKSKISPNTIQKYFINLNGSKEGLVSVKKEPESPDSSNKFAQTYFTAIRNLLDQTSQN